MIDGLSAQATMDGFELGRPALVCRWRLAGATLPLENRHLRALGSRRLGEAAVSAQLVAWAKQHIEWTLTDGAARNPDGVLMTVIDEQGRAAMAVGPYEPLVRTSAASLAGRAERAAREGAETGVSPETLWAFSEDRLLWGARREEAPSGAASLVSDLARTLGIAVEVAPDLAERVRSGEAGLEEVLLASDEHGIVLARDAQGPRAQRFSAGYEKLLSRAREGRR